jgi:ADP-ribosylation factor-like protein 2
VERLQDCRAELSNLLKEERLAGATLLVLANKQDLHGAATPAEIAEALQLAAVQRRHWKIQSCSAFSGEGLEEGMRFLVDDIASRIFSAE